MRPLTAQPWLADWLETGPVRPEMLRRVLVVGEPADAELVAARAPTAHVAVVDRLRTAGDGGRYDLVAVVDRPWPGRARTDLAAAADAVAPGGMLLVIAGAGRSETPIGRPWDPAAAGLRLIAFDDLIAAVAADDDAEPRRWLRATFR